MSTDVKTANETLVESLYESFTTGDLEGVERVMSPDIELHMPRGFANGGAFRGFDEIVSKVFVRQGKEWENVSVVPARYVTDGATVIALYTWSGTARATGKSVEFEGAHVFDFEDGTIVRWTSYADTALFNAALDP
jgi:ketosteroid isomerase-like protein